LIRNYKFYRKKYICEAELIGYGGIKIRVLLAGGILNISPLFITSPFCWEMKGFEFHNTAKTFLDCLTKDTEIEITHMSTWDVYKGFPRTIEELSKFDVIIIADAEAQTFYLYPEFFKAATWAKEGSLTFPNRPELIRQYVENGGGLLMAGGWLSFQGRFGWGQWHDTPVEEALPVNCLPHDDLMETPEGGKIEVVDPDHPLMKGIPWETCPPLLGFNKTELKPDAKLLATISGANKKKYPLIAVRDYGKGRSMIFASSILPHWGANFLKWKYYGELWIRSVKWLAKKLI